MAAQRRSSRSSYRTLLKVPQQAAQLPTTAEHLWNALDDCGTIESGVLLSPDAFTRLVNAAVALFDLTTKAAEDTMRGYLPTYVIGSRWRWLPDGQRLPMLEALAERQRQPPEPAVLPIVVRQPRVVLELDEEPWPF